ncbi:MAG: O-antigen ligase family protein [Gemmatimonadales bacterium]|nr:O-antigen ligase family protein [Gemmatimonadales bacterium]
MAAIAFALVAVTRLHLAITMLAPLALFTNIFGAWLASGATSVGGLLRDFATLALLGAWVAGRQRAGRPAELTRGRLGLLAFGALVVLLALASEDRGIALVGTRNYILYAGLLFAVSDLLRDEAPRRRAVQALLGGYLVMTLLAVAEVATNGAALSAIGFDLSYSGAGASRQEAADTFLGRRRATAAVGNALDFGWLCMFAFLLAVAWRPTSRAERWLHRATLAGAAVGLVLSLTRSAWLGAAGGLVAMAVLAGDGRARRALLAAAAAAGLALLAFPEAAAVERLLNRDISSQRTTSGRLEIYEYAAGFAARNPLGVGIGVQGSANTDIVDPRRFTLDSYYLQMVGDGGVPLAAAYLAAMAMLLLELRRRARRGTGIDRSLATAGVGLVAAVLLANVTSGSMDSRIISIQLWTLLGLAMPLPAGQPGGG